ncbi:MAG: MCE family protein [Solirubrobacterales bacterium]|nr:MCE family protein [Solirubrobacterales bacterium]
MNRIGRALIALLLSIGVGAVATFAVVRLTGGGPSGYLVRAIFDNSSFVTPGEDVKVAGVRVGTIHAVQLTSSNKAALVLEIDNRNFEPFRTDAHCEIGIESLLGEQFVQCTPAQPRTAGDPEASPLPAIRSGPDQGQHVLPVQNTTTPVGFDLLQDITRLPQQEALRLIITGLGAGFDANGQELNAALARADPALQQTDRVIAVLVRQDRVLANLTDESARILQPLAAQRLHIGGFIQHAGTVAVASAREQSALAQNVHDLPPFLRQLQPAAIRLTGLARQLTPALQTLQAHGPQINAALRGLGPLVKPATPALVSLGAVAQRGERIFPEAYPVTAQLLALGKPLVPLANDIATVATSFDNAGGIEDVMRFIYYYAGAVNGENVFGHFIRSLVTITSISRTSTAIAGQGSANFQCALRNCPANASLLQPQPPGAKVVHKARGLTKAVDHKSAKRGRTPRASTPPSSTPGSSRPVSSTRVSSAPAGSPTAQSAALLRYLLAP